MVEHSYSKRNLYAIFGNLWIGLGPLFSGLAVIVAVLCLVYPASMQTYRDNVGLLLTQSVPATDMLALLWQLICGLFVEQSRDVWMRIVAIVLLFSTVLHVRLSAQDVASMLSGMPGFALVTAVVACIVTAIGDTALYRLQSWTKQVALWLIALFALILVFCLLLLLFVVAWRILQLLLREIFGIGKN